MKRCILLVMIATCMLVGCVSNTIRHWEFTYSFDYVKEIKLVEMIDERAYTVIKEIDVELAEELYTDISGLEMKRYGTNLMRPYGICFLVMFQSGEYDIISQREPKRYKPGQERLEAYNSWLECDKEEFQKLIEKYM